MGGISKIDSFEIKRKGSAPGKAIVATTEAAGGQERSTEFYQLPGFAAGPTPDDVPVEVRVGTGGRIIVASQNYKITVDVSAGETLIYSTDAAGENIKAQIKLDTDGNISINGEDKVFVTHTELNTALQTFVTALNTSLASKLDGSGTTGALTLDISSAATTTVKTGG